MQHMAILKIFSTNLDFWSAERHDSLAAFLIGALSFICADMIVPRTNIRLSEHDHLLATYVVLIYSPIIACWFKNIRKDGLTGLIKPIAIGLLIGFINMWLCNRTHNFIAIVIVYPSALVAALNALTQYYEAEKPILARVLRASSDGLLAGFAMGLTYWLLLNGGLLCLYLSGLLGTYDYAQYFRAMSWLGPFAFGLASCLCFFLLRRAQKKSTDSYYYSRIRETSRLIFVLFVIAVLSEWHLVTSIIFDLIKYISAQNQ